MNQHYFILQQTTRFPSPLPDIHPDKQALSLLVHSVEAREPKLQGHGARTAWYSLELGKALCLPELELEYLRNAAYLHDVGKLSVSQDILAKQEPLTSQEYHQLHSHPSAAITLLASWPFLKIPSIWIAHHHERWDGSGYPNGLKGTFIPLGSRIIAIADTFDVLTLRNRDALEKGPEICLSTLQWYAGSHFDPELIDTFSKIASKWAVFRERNVGLDTPPTKRFPSDLNPSLIRRDIGSNHNILSDTIRHDTPNDHQTQKGDLTSSQRNPTFVGDDLITPG